MNRRMNQWINEWIQFTCNKIPPKGLASRNCANIFWKYSTNNPFNQLESDMFLSLIYFHNKIYILIDNCPIE